MNGATGLKIDLREFTVKDLDKLSKDIGFEHIVSTFYYSTKEQFDWLKKLADEDKLIGTAINTENASFGTLNNTRSVLVKAIDVQYRSEERRVGKECRCRR